MFSQSSLTSSVKTLNGKRLIEDVRTPEFTIEPVKKVEAKRWMAGKCYCRRVQKKWNKIHGFKKERLFLITLNSIIAHPNNIKKIVKEVSRQ